MFNFLCYLLAITNIISLKKSFFFRNYETLLLLFIITIILNNPIQVTLTYMRENGAPSIGAKSTSIAEPNNLSATSFSKAGSLQLNYRNNLFIGRKNVAQVQPYKVYEDGSVQFNNGKYLEVSYLFI